MRNATPRFNSLHIILALKRLYFVALICLVAASPVFAQKKQKQQTIQGYAEYYQNGFLIVEGQRIAANQFTVFKKVPSLAGTPLGSEVKVKGVRQPDGSFLASQLEAKPNSIGSFEPQVLARADATENLWVSNGMMLVQGPDGEWQNGGRIISDGPGVDRVRNIMARLLPPYIRPDRIRVRLVENEAWNASAMPNGAIWVFTALLRDMSDDELAIILGHELSHFTYEHSRRQAKQQMWINLAAAVAGGVTKNPMAQRYMVMGLSAWRSGYSRDHEDQADRVGLRYAYEAGFDVEKGSRVWLRMLEKYGDNDKFKNLIEGGHSLNSERFTHLQNEISLNYPSPPTQPTQPTRPTEELAGIVVTPPTQPTVRPAPAITAIQPVGRRPDALMSLSAQPSTAAAAATRPLPPHVVRNAGGKLLPASGYQWLNSADPEDLRVQLMPGLVNTEDGKLRPASGYQWLNPTDPKDFRVKLIPGLVKTEEDFHPEKGYRWVNPKDPKDLRVEPIP